MNVWSDACIKLLEARDPTDLTSIESGALAKRTLLYDPAEKRALDAASRRLKIRLPPSMSTFYLSSNGLDIPCFDAEDTRLWPIERLTLHREASPELVSKPDRDEYEVRDEDYFVYGVQQDCANIRESYLWTAVQLSDYVDSAVLLLNPQISVVEGELEAWYLGNKLPGAFRYKTFEDLILHVCENSLEALERGD